MEGRIVDLLKALRALVHHLPAAGRRSCELDQCGGRYAAEDQFAGRDLPADRVAGVDAFLLAAGSVGGVFRVAGAFTPTAPPPGPPAPGDALRVEAGTPVPEGSLPVRVEGACLVGTDLVRIEKVERAAVRGNGSFFRKGQRVAARGERMAEGAIASLAACGYDRIEVLDFPTIHVAAIGDEIARGVCPEVTARWTVQFLRRFGMPAIFVGLLPDCIDRIRSELAQTVPKGLLVACGGTGRGLTDRTGLALRAYNLRILCDGIAMAPGRSSILAAGAEGACVALPGDPQAAVAVAHLLLKPALARKYGLLVPTWPHGQRHRLAVPWRGPAESHILLPAMLRDQALEVVDRDGSGGLLRAEVMALLAPGLEERAAGVALFP